MWADGRVAPEERDFLRDTFSFLKLEPEDWKQVAPLLETPISSDEFQALVSDFTKVANEKSDLAVLGKQVQDLFRADGELTEEERRWKDQLLETLASRGSPGSIVDRLKNWFRRGTDERTQLLHDFYDVEGFFKNRVLFHVKRRLKERGEAVPLDEERLEVSCLLGGILAKVAFADSETSEQERLVIKKALASRPELSESEREAILGVLEERLCKDLDPIRLMTEYRDRVDYEGKLRLVELILQVATTDRKVTKAEQQGIEDLVYHLRIDRSDFTRVRARYWDHFEQ